MNVEMVRQAQGPGHWRRQPDIKDRASGRIGWLGDRLDSPSIEATALDTSELPLQDNRKTSSTELIQ
jgi:hypothetical protein